MTQAPEVDGPVRTCIGCGRKTEKKLLRRLALGAMGVEVDRTGRAAGRGAYLCGPGCLAAAAKRKSFLRAFRGKAGPLDLERLEVALRES